MKTVNKYKLFFIFIPIFLQTFFFMLSSVVDTMIISSVSDEAVAAVGTASTYVGTTSLLFAVISGGLLAVMTQYIGAGQNGVAYALAQANLVICGWCIGGGNLKECYPSTKKAAIIGICAGIAVELLLALISPYLFKMFTTDQKIVKVVRIILFIDIALEVGRAGNLIYGQTLKGTGDSIFPMVAASITTALVAIGGSYLFGVVFKMEVYGVYISLSIDEVIRAIIMFIRWISRKWEKKVLVKTQVATD